MARAGCAEEEALKKKEHPRTDRQSELARIGEQGAFGSLGGAISGNLCLAWHGRCPCVKGVTWSAHLPVTKDQNPGARRADQAAVILA